jgi:hypothetical protein
MDNYWLSNHKMSIQGCNSNFILLPVKELKRFLEVKIQKNLQKCFNKIACRGMYIFYKQIGVCLSDFEDISANSKHN